MFEARRYRYFNVWRARCRLMETDVIGPMLRGEGVADGREVEHAAGGRLLRCHGFHISQVRSIGRRLRKNYAYILSIQALAYFGKLAIHPTPASSFAMFLSRATIGPLPGVLVVLAGLAFHGSWIALAL